NKKMKRKALFMVLSDKVAGGKISIVEDLNLVGVKTKKIKALFEKLSIKRSALVVIEKMEKSSVCAGRNLPRTEIMAANSLNVYDTLNAHDIVITEKALEVIEKTFLKK
ncbi:MAG: 50S ribosomal protein L4, partial [Parcubacteria group bacterium]